MIVQIITKTIYRKKSLISIFEFFFENILNGPYEWLMQRFCSFEPRHDKTNKVSVRPAKTQISLGVRMKKPWTLSYPLSAHWRLWSDWADAQADLSLRWAHTHFVCFVMRRLICCLAFSQSPGSIPTGAEFPTGNNVIVSSFPTTLFFVFFSDYTNLSSRVALISPCKSVCRCYWNWKWIATTQKRNNRCFNI